GDEFIIVWREGINVTQRARSCNDDLSLFTICATRHILQSFTLAESFDDLGKRLFALADYYGVNRRFLQALVREKRWMPAAPNNRQIRPNCFHRTRRVQSVTYWRASKHSHAYTQGAIEMREHRGHGIGFQTSVDNDDLILGRIERRPNGN